MSKTRKPKRRPRAGQLKLSKRKSADRRADKSKARTRSKRGRYTRAVNATHFAGRSEFVGTEAQMSSSKGKPVVEPIIPAPLYVLAKMHINSDGVIVIEAHRNRRRYFNPPTIGLTRDVREMRAFNNRQTAGHFRATHAECRALSVLNVQALVAPYVPSTPAKADKAA